MIEINYEALESKSEADIEAMINYLLDKDETAYDSTEGSEIAEKIITLKTQFEKRINNLFII